MPSNDSAALDHLDLSPELAQMEADVLEGLSDPDQKWLPSRYLYDERGSQLFDDICNTEDYYPTRTEIGILRDNIDDIARMIGPRAALIEPGSGAGVKTQLLLEHMIEPVAVVPLDISKEFALAAAAEINERFPKLLVKPVIADFLSDFHLPDLPDAIEHDVFFFPGSTIGNIHPPEAIDLLRRLVALGGEKTCVLIGVDLEKDPAVLERAYNDSDGVTEAFTMNYFERLNADLDAGFKLDELAFRSRFNTTDHRIEIGVESLADQRIEIGNRVISLAKGETIRTECCYKYTVERFAELAANAGLAVERVWTDERRWFSVQYLTSKHD